MMCTICAVCPENVLRRSGDTMKIDLRSLLAGEIHTLPLAFSLGIEETDEPSDPLYGVSFCGPAEVTGEIVNTAGYIRLSLRLSVPYKTPCARCLAPVQGLFSLDVERTVVTPRQAEDMEEDTEDEYLVTEDGFLDMDELLTDLVSLNFPFKILCREDCRGLCPRCGADLNAGPCSCDTKTQDPRLAEPLKALLERLKKEEAEEKPSDFSK